MQCNQKCDLEQCENSDIDIETEKRLCRANILTSDHRQGSSLVHCEGCLGT